MRKRSEQTEYDCLRSLRWIFVVVARPQHDVALGRIQASSYKAPVVQNIKVQTTALSSRVVKTAWILLQNVEEKEGRTSLPRLALRKLCVVDFVATSCSRLLLPFNVSDYLTLQVPGNLGSNLLLRFLLLMSVALVCCVHMCCVSNSKQSCVMKVNVLLALCSCITSR